MADNKPRGNNDYNFGAIIWLILNENLAAQRIIATFVVSLVAEIYGFTSGRRLTLWYIKFIVLLSITLFILTETEFWLGARDLISFDAGWVMHDSTMAIIFLSFLFSSAVVVFLLPKILLFSLRRRLVDKVDPRKIHNVPASRLGGVTFLPAILCSVLFCIALTYQFPPIIEISLRVILIIFALLLLFFMGLYDDVSGVSYKKKFIVQIAAAVLMTLSGAYFHSLHGFLGIYEIPMYVGIPMAVLFYVFVTNSINLIDGIDGLASLLSIMALFVYTILLYINDLMTICLISAAALGALVPFCYSNVFGIKPGAQSKIFMGDTGALGIGTILGAVAMRLWNQSEFLARTSATGMGDDFLYIMAYTMLLVPCFDVIRIIITRFRNKKPLFLPDKNHIHHRFMALGCSPRVALLCIVGTNAFFVVLNLILSYVMNITIVLLIDVLVWTTLHLIVARKIQNKQTLSSIIEPITTKPKKCETISSQE